MEPAYKLTYFSTRGYAEPIRYLFKYGNIDFEDVRIKKEDWPKFKEEMPFGQLPILEHNGKRVSQSTAIIRFVAKQVGLVGANDWEDLEIDAVVDSIKDLILKLVPIRFDPDEDKRMKLKQDALHDTLPFYLKRLDGLVQKNNGYLAVGKLTWADFYFVGLSETICLIFDPDIIDEYPNLAALRRKVWEIPAVKNWLETRPEYEF